MNNKVSKGLSRSRIVFRLIAFVGIWLLGVAAYILFWSLGIIVFGERTEGVVIENFRRETNTDSPFYARVRFERDGTSIEFKSYTGTHPALHQVGDKVTVYFIPSNPTIAVIDGFYEIYLRPIIAASFGLVILAIGGGLLWGPGWLERRRLDIVADGVPVKARVTAVKLDGSLEVNDVSPWVIYAEFTDTDSGRTIKCKSHHVWENPSARYPVGSDVTIYHLRFQPDKYAFQLNEGMWSDESTSDAGESFFKEIT